MGPCELAVNTRGGPHIGTRPRVRGPRRARAGCRAGAPRGTGARGSPSGRGKTDTPPPRVSRDRRGHPRTRERDRHRRFAVGLRFGATIERDVVLRMMVHEFECAQYGAPCINTLTHTNYTTFHYVVAVFSCVPRLPPRRALKFGRRWLGSVGVAARRHLDLLRHLSLCRSRNASFSVGRGEPAARSPMACRTLGPTSQRSDRGE